MKTKILFLLFTSILFSCKIAYGQTAKKNIRAKKINARLIVCSGLSEKNIPLDDLKEIYVNEGEKVTLYVKWFNLKKKNILHQWISLILMEIT